MNNDESLLNDCYRIGGKYFPVPDKNTDKGQENGPQELVSQSDKQKAPRLNASEGYGPTVKGKEGKSFSTTDNGKESDDEKPVFAGSRDASVGINLATGQIESSNESRIVPIPQEANDTKIRPLVKFRKATSDIRENRI